MHSLHQIDVWIDVLLLSAITFTLFFLFRFRRSNATESSPPSPPKLPIIGNLHQLGQLPHRSMRALSERYGSLMLLHLGSVPTLIVSSAEMAYEVMKTHDLDFASRPPSVMAKMLLYDRDVVFAPYGDYWRQVRKICVVNLLSTKMLQSSFQPIREEEVSALVDRIRSAQHGTVDLSELLLTLSINVVGRVALGRKNYEGEGGSHKMRNMLSDFVALMGSFPIGDFIPWLGWLDGLSGLHARARKNSEELEGFLEGVLEEHRQAKTDSSSKEDRDFVDVLLSLDGKAENTSDVSLQKDSIKALILDMFIAGTETTFTTLVWAMAELMKNPKIMKRVQEEVRDIIGSKEVIKDKDTNRMLYLKATIKETLRFHPPVPLLIPRETIKEVKLRGFHIPAGARVIVNAWAIGRDPSLWEKPEEFLPDRFINSNIDFKGQDFQFIPFGAGRRSCPGIGFAIPTIELTMANLLHWFDWDLPKGLEKEILDMSEGPGIAVQKKSDLVLIANSHVI